MKTFALVFSLIASFAAGICFDGNFSDNYWRAEAVRTGHAEYVLRGDRAVWQWREIKQ